MTTAELISQLIGRGIELKANGDKLRIGPNERLTATDVANIRQHKAAILGLLRAEGLFTAHPACNAGPRTVCDRCDATETIDTPIHDGRSLRRDCGRRHRFLGWPFWYGRTLDAKEEDSR